MASRVLKERLYPEFARIAHAMASERRLEIIDLLAQAPRNVDALAKETETPVANVSQHLGVLRTAKLVVGERKGTRTYYRLAGDDVRDLWLALREIGSRRLPEVGQEVADSGSIDPALIIPRGEVEALMQGTPAPILIDVRPAIEYAHGHIRGAKHVEPGSIADAFTSLPEGRKVIAYCRGPYCVFADDAVRMLRAVGREAFRMEGGWPEWAAEGRELSAAAG